MEYPISGHPSSYLELMKPSMNIDLDQPIHHQLAQINLPQQMEPFYFLHTRMQCLVHQHLGSYELQPYSLHDQTGYKQHRHLGFQLRIHL